MSSAAIFVWCFKGKDKLNSGYSRMGKVGKAWAEGQMSDQILVKTPAPEDYVFNS